jgi:hypothetical protein
MKLRAKLKVIGWAFVGIGALIMVGTTLYFELSSAIKDPAGFGLFMLAMLSGFAFIIVGAGVIPRISPIIITISRLFSKGKERTAVPLDIRERILARARGHCELCGVSGFSLDIHHKNNDPSNNRPENLIAVCPNCHRKIQG